MLHGVVGAEFSCKHFSYDLTKRIPASRVAKPEDSQNNFQGTERLRFSRKKKKKRGDTPYKVRCKAL